MTGHRADQIRSDASSTSLARSALTGMLAATAWAYIGYPAVLLAQIRRLPSMLDRLRTNKQRFKAGIADLPGLEFRELTDPEGPEARLLQIETGRHPVVERFLPAGQFVPNDMRLDVDDGRMAVFTGGFAMEAAEDVCDPDDDFVVDIEVELEDVIYHCRAVSRGTTRAHIVGDMPFMSYQVSTEDALRNAGRFLQEGGMDAIKLEGGRERLEAVRAITGAGIPVMGHIGLTPQSQSQLGGYRVQGKTAVTARRLLLPVLLPATLLLVVLFLVVVLLRVVRARRAFLDRRRLLRRCRHHLGQFDNGIIISVATFDDIGQLDDLLVGGLRREYNIGQFDDGVVIIVIR